MTPKFRLPYQSSIIEPTLLTNRLYHLQQRQEYETLIQGDDSPDKHYSELQTSIYHQRNPHSTSYNGLSGHSNVAAASDNYYPQQKKNHWLSPPISDNFRMF